MPEILSRIPPAGRPVLMLDFDGTLSPIAPTPAQALLPPNMRSLLRDLSQIMPVAIVSGRELGDLKRKVRIPGLIYAGNHGWEWEIDGHRRQRPLPPAFRMSVGRIRRALPALALRYPGILLEAKRFSVAVHYRGVADDKVPHMRKEVDEAVKPFLENSALQIMPGKKVVEIRPAAKWGKGELTRFICDILKENGKKIVPLYLGDDVTDEDAFRALSNGITIRVGRTRRSSAHYYLNGLDEVRSFLEQVLAAQQPSPGKQLRARSIL